VTADEALKEALESRGVLNRLKAKVGAEIYKLVDHPSRVSTSFDFVSSGFSFFLSFSITRQFRSFMTCIELLLWNTNNSHTSFYNGGNA
jgi:hypothetical protein